MMKGSLGGVLFIMVQHFLLCLRYYLAVSALAKLLTPCMYNIAGVFYHHLHISIHYTYTINMIWERQCHTIILLLHHSLISWIYAVFILNRAFCIFCSHEQLECSVHSVHLLSLLHFANPRHMVFVYNPTSMLWLSRYCFEVATADSQHCEEGSL